MHHFSTNRTQEDNEAGRNAFPAFDRNEPPPGNSITANLLGSHEQNLYMYTDVKSDPLVTIICDGFTSSEQLAYAR
jgi:hypothetical protein